MLMKEYVNKLLELSGYVDYISKEKVKVPSFLNGIPQNYKDKIGFVDPETLNEVIRMAMHCYDKNKEKLEAKQVWKGKKKRNLD